MNIPLNIDWQQILLHLFNFSILVANGRTFRPSDCPMAEKRDLAMQLYQWMPVIRNI